MARTFKPNPNDVVQLISGGPRMTITQMGAGQGGDQKVWCVWYEGGKRREDAFTVSALALAPDESYPVKMTTFDPNRLHTPAR